MKRASLNRIEKLESKNIDEDMKITIIQKIVDRDEEGNLYIKEGYRYTIGSDEPEEYLPREYFEGVDPLS